MMSRKIKFVITSYSIHYTKLYEDALLTLVPLGIITYVLLKLFSQTFKKYTLGNLILSFSFIIIWAIVLWKVFREFTAAETEVPATWFGILNSLFIIIFAPVFSKWWESKYNLSGPFKFAVGRITSYNVCYTKLLRR